MHLHRKSLPNHGFRLLPSPTRFVSITNAHTMPAKIRQYHTTFRLIYKLMDVLAIGAGLKMVLVSFPEVDSRATLVTFLISAGLFSIVSELTGVYRNWHGIRFEREATSWLFAWAITILGLLSLGFFSQAITELSPGALKIWLAYTPIVSLAGRIICRWIMQAMIRKGTFARGFAIIGINDLGLQLVNNIEGTPELGLRFLGFYDDRPEQRTIPIPEGIDNRLGTVADLVAATKRNEVSVVFITLPLRAEDRIRGVIEKLSDSTASVYLVPDLFVFQLLHSRWSDIQGVPVVSVFENPFYGVDGMLKRTCDVALATLAIAIAGIPMLAIAAAVKLTSRGPVLFRQRRYGLDGREIRVLKFRTMTVCEDGANVRQAQKNDSRLTPIGGFLRSTSLDELPQLFNVLAGSMSMIGPRPHANAHNELYRTQIDGYMLRHKVKPGITGLAQVNGCRGETDTVDKMQRRVQFDHQYIREWTIWLDLGILWKTFAIVFRRQNAW